MFRLIKKRRLYRLLRILVIGYTAHRLRFINKYIYYLYVKHFFLQSCYIYIYRAIMSTVYIGYVNTVGICFDKIKFIL